MLKQRRGFTLIELLISITLTFFLVYTVYLMLDSSLEIWTFSRRDLALQKVLHDTLSRVVSGSPEKDGLKDALELVEADAQSVSFMGAWVDDTHTVADANFMYRLNRQPKASAAPPIAEVRMPETDKYALVPIKVIDLGEEEAKMVTLGANPPEGSLLRFTYWIDPAENPDAVQTIWFDQNNGELKYKDKDDEVALSQNALGVRITDFQLRYFDRQNKPVGRGGRVNRADLLGISGMEVSIDGEIDGHKYHLLEFVNLRNAPMSTGRIPLTQGARFLIPSSREAHTLLLTDISRVRGDGELVLEARSERGGTWAIKIKFFRVGSLAPKIRSYTVEYPVGTVICMETPETDATRGLNLLVLDQQGQCDYRHDPEIKDRVDLEGPVTLEVKRMDIGGAALMVKP